MSPANTGPRVDADPDRDSQRRRLHLPQRRQHPRLVVAGRGGGAGHQDDLAAVVVDVGGQEGDAVVVAGRLRRRHQRTQRVGHRLVGLRLDQLVDAVVVDEADRDPAVLGLAVAVQQRVAQRHRDAVHQIAAARHQLRLGLVARSSASLSRRSRRSSKPVALGAGHELRGHAARGLRADHDLAGVGGALHGHHRAGAGAGHDAARGGESPTRKNWNSPECTPTDIRSRTLPAEVWIWPDLGAARGACRWQRRRRRRRASRRRTAAAARRRRT